MQYVNDDMDELFRKAAKDYPLNTGGADWEKVAKALQEPPKDNSSSARRDRRHLLWLLLLLPLPWICTRYVDEGGKTAGDAHPARQQTTRPVNENTSETSIVNNASTGQEMAPEAPGLFSAISSSSTVGAKGNKASFGATGRGDDFVNQRTLPGGEMETRREVSAAPPSEDSEQQDDLSTVPHKGAKEIAVATAPVKDTVKQDTATTPEPLSVKTPKLPKTKRFYAGVLGGLDATSIEMQKVKKAGYDIGGVVGYVLNERWSVETGLLSSEKAYYTSGEHLYKVYLLPGTKLKEAEGDCRMWEVPLVVRYRFTPGSKGGWFASAGSSSYLMKKESYDYTYSYMATGQEVKRSRSYKSESRHLFAAAQLSGGYNWRLGKSMELRIEPYVKLPLRKVGYYELPLTSFGIHAGITKRLF